MSPMIMTAHIVSNILMLLEYTPHPTGRDNYFYTPCLHALSGLDDIRDMQLQFH